MATAPADAEEGDRKTVIETQKEEETEMNITHKHGVCCFSVWNVCRPDLNLEGHFTVVYMERAGRAFLKKFGELEGGLTWFRESPAKSFVEVTGLVRQLMIDSFIKRLGTVSLIDLENTWPERRHVYRDDEAAIDYCMKEVTTDVPTNYDKM